MTARLAGKVVIVTGGTRGMGEAEVRGIVSEGGSVCFGGRDEAAGRAIEADLDGHALYVRQDVANEAYWQHIVSATLERFGTITGLVNNAGLVIREQITDLTTDNIHRMIGVNQLGALLGIKHVSEPMRQNGGGAIVNIGSAVALRAHAGVIAYSATKAAVVGLSLAAAAELAPINIRVNVVHPGFFATRLLDEASRGAGRVLGKERTPLKRVAEPEEIVGPITFLLSDESSFVTGAQLTVDGGLTM
jgi:3alpha(or 20beta)-hydroxysteroid dehydrogenase